MKRVRFHRNIFGHIQFIATILPRNNYKNTATPQKPTYRILRQRFIAVFALNLILLSFFITSCEKPERVTIIKTEVLINEGDNKYLTGYIVDLGEGDHTDHGFIVTYDQAEKLVFSLGRPLARGPIKAPLPPLMVNKSYKVWCFITTDGQTMLSNNQINFKIEGYAPIVTTKPISELTSSSMNAFGEVRDDGGAVITQRGFVLNTTPNPTIEKFLRKIHDSTPGIGEYFTTITGLNPKTTYYIRAYATNSIGTRYGDQITFTTLSPPPVIVSYFNNSLQYGEITDIEGNTYKTIVIGNQEWMAENLRVTKYNDGSFLSRVTNSDTWAHLKTPAYCWYNNSYEQHGITHGALYNWLVVNPASNGNKNICPVGWKVPSNNDWSVLIDHLGGLSVAGGKMKAQGLWKSPNTKATNSSGFTALPSGARQGYFNGNFHGLGEMGGWLSSTASGKDGAWAYFPYYNDEVVNHYSYYQQRGWSIRCIKE